MDDSLITWGFCILILALGSLAWRTFAGHRSDFREHKRSVADKLDGLRERQAETHTSVETMSVQLQAGTDRMQRHTQKLGALEAKAEVHGTRLTKLEARRNG